MIGRGHLGGRGPDCFAVVALSVALSACNAQTKTVGAEPVSKPITNGPPVVEFGPGVSGQFRRARSVFAARPVLTQAEYMARNAAPKGASGAASLPSADADPEIVAAFFGDRTVLTHSAQHGTQVEYIAANGDSFLWYPGNDAILRSTFAVLWENASAEIDDPQEGRYRGQVKLNYVCFRYAANSYNPATGHRGGGFECGTYARQRDAVKETRKGDVFGLATRSSAPFPLGREAQTIAALQKRVGTSR
ncbi:MAG TPA: hypothetical protein VGO06_08875 [Bosea sp. (in: a-proteobacteria)]|jgi:hypothetical protein|uniref:hypothetical protein n=1 Tax=Bosea sp. (in: a-proteobacteria) TaxID=1871050 RepID=UPI002E163134|nr:hypothetical protein [Bosea sp. (in: a-proteobacteria)]